MKYIYFLVSVYVILAFITEGVAYGAFWDTWGNDVTALNQAQAQTQPEADAEEDDITRAQRLINEAQSLLRENEPEAAREMILEAQEILPQDPTAQRTLIETYLAQGRNQNAKSILAQTISRPEFSELIFWATRRYYDLFENSGGIEAAIEQLEGLSPNASVQKAMAQGYARLRDWSRVTEIYEELLRADPTDHFLADRLANYYMMNRDYSAAVNILEQLIRNNPENTSYTNSLLDAYTKGGQEEQALSLYRRQIEQKPQSPGLHGRYAQALMEFGRLQESLAQWERAYQLDSSNLYFKQRMGETAMEAGDYERARVELNELIRLATQQKNTRVKKIATEHLKTLEELSNQ